MGNLGILNILSIIFNTSPPCVGALDDDFMWGATTSGNFSAKSAYACLLNVNGVALIFDFQLA